MRGRKGMKKKPMGKSVKKNLKKPVVKSVRRRGR